MYYKKQSVSRSSKMVLFYVATIAIFLLSYLHCYFKKKLSYFDAWGIPHIPGWPIFGNIASVVFRQRYLGDLSNEIYNCDRNAKYVGLFNFMEAIIMLRDPELIKTVAVKNFENFSEHVPFVDITIDPIFGGSLFNLRQDVWKRSRSTLSPTFTSSKMKSMFDLIVHCAQNLVNHISQRSPEENTKVNLKDLLTRFTNDSIASTAFGIDVDSINQSDSEFYSIGKKATNIQGILGIKLLSARSFPRLMRLFKIRMINEQTERFFDNVIETTVSMREKNNFTRPDMLQLMMDARTDEAKKSDLSMKQITAHAFSFFFGGFDTTSTQMSILAHELAINPDVQKRLQEEIDQVVKTTNGKPSYEAIQGMVYMDAFVNEGLRRHTQATFIDRVCTKEIELPPAVPGGKPFVVKPGQVIWIPAASIHLDPKYYDDPLKFDPQRFIDKKLNINDPYFMSFGIGPRGCIGYRLAILNIKVMLFFLLAKFNLVPNEKTCNPIVYDPKGVFIVPVGGYCIDIVPKN